jgi:hypothetical protein
MIIFLADSPDEEYKPFKVNEKVTCVTFRINSKANYRIIKLIHEVALERMDIGLPVSLYGKSTGKRVNSDGFTLSNWFDLTRLEI